MIRLVVFTDIRAPPALVYHFTVGNLCNRRPLHGLLPKNGCVVARDAATEASSLSSCLAATQKEPGHYSDDEDADMEH